MRLDVGDDAGRGLGLRAEDDPRAALGDRGADLVRRRAPRPTRSRSAARRGRSARRSSTQRSPNAPATTTATRSPGAARFATADSIAPVPDALKSSTWPRVRNTCCEPLERALVDLAEVGARGGAPSARPSAASTSGGTGRRAGREQVALLHRAQASRRAASHTVAWSSARLRRRARLAPARRRAAARAASPGPARCSPTRSLRPRIAWGAAHGWDARDVPRLLPRRRAADRAAPRHRLAPARPPRVGGALGLLWTGLAVGVALAMPCTDVRRRDSGGAGSPRPAASRGRDRRQQPRHAARRVALATIRRRPLGNALILAGSRSRRSGSRSRASASRPRAASRSSPPCCSTSASSSRAGCRSRTPLARHRALTSVPGFSPRFGAGLFAHTVSGARFDRRPMLSDAQGHDLTSVACASVHTPDWRFTQRRGCPAEPVGRRATARRCARSFSRGAR